MCSCTAVFVGTCVWFSLYEDISGRQGYFLESQNYFLTFALWRKTDASSKVGQFLRGTCLFLFFCIKWGHFLRNSQAGPQAGPSEGCFRKAIQHKIFAKSNMCVISKSDHCCPVRTLVWKTRENSEMLEILTLGVCLKAPTLVSVAHCLGPV